MYEHALFHDRASLKAKARERLNTYKSNSIGVMVIYTVIVAVVGAISFGLGDLFLMPPLVVGLSMYFLAVWRGGAPTFEMLFSGFYRYMQSLVGILWMYLWIFLWSLLFIIPGIVKSMAYAMTPYLLADFPNLDPQEALKVSMAMTDGHKMEIFVMYMSFLGWLILSGFTFGILYLLHVGPYMQITLAGQYEMLLADAVDRKLITTGDLDRWS